MKAPRLVIMGVSGCGKSTVGTRLAERLGVAFLEGDALHPPRNIALMRSGVALTDDDRRDWLDAIAQHLEGLRDDDGLVIACSALKRSYRDRLRRACPHLQFVHLHGTQDAIAQRLAQRRDHYMPSTLLASQFDILETPHDDEPAWTLDVNESVDQLVDHITHHLQAHTP
jgi:gluconokinase